LTERLTDLRARNKLLEAQRLESRTNFDVDMLLEVGRCTGIENYSRHLTGRAAGERPACLLDYFPPDYLCILDESHQTLPQLGGMYEGDRSRKQTLVDYGFRLHSALDNRPRGPRSGGPSRQGTGGRPAARDPAARKERRAGTRHHPHQADGRGPDRLPAAARGARALSPFRDRRDRTGGNHSGPATRRVRRSGGNQSAARGTRSAGSVARRHPGRRPGRVPALRPVAHPDRGTRRAQPAGAGDPLRRPRHRFDAARPGRDVPPAAGPGGVQRGARHHPPLDREIGDQVRFATRFADAKTARPAEASMPRPADAKQREALIALLESQMQAAAEELDFEL